MWYGKIKNSGGWGNTLSFSSRKEAHNTLYLLAKGRRYMYLSSSSEAEAEELLNLVPLGFLPTGCNYFSFNLTK